LTFWAQNFRLPSYHSSIVKVLPTDTVF